MANYAATHMIRLEGVTRTGNESLSWTGITDFEQARTVNDTAPTGELDLTDSFAGTRFSGFYIDVGGQFYGVFFANSTWVVPYDKVQADIATSPAFSANTTTNYLENLVDAANCFLAGTRIDTPTGARAIETLAPGDAILTADRRVVAAMWLWRQDSVTIMGRDTGPVAIRIATDALGPGCPSAPLTVTADHAVLIDGVLINAGALVNGTTICTLSPDQLPPRASYWHIETAAHDLILAQGCAAETFLDYGGRAAMAGHADYLARYGADRVIAELPLQRICTARHLPPDLRKRLGITRAA